MAINKKLIHFEKRENFDTRLANNEINDTSIVFIQDTGELWTHGLFFCTTATNLLEAPVLTTSGDTIAVQIGDKTSNYIVPPAALKGRTMYECITDTADTRGHWTGTIPGVTELYDGLVIHVRFTTAYYGNGEGYNTLNINNLGPKLVWFRYNSILTSHWSSNTEMTLTYRTTAGSYKVGNAKGELTNGTTYTDGWVADFAYYTYTDYMSSSYYYRYKVNANGYIGRYMIVMRCPDGTITGLTTTNNSTATTKTMFSGPLLLDDVHYYSSTNTYAANAVFTHDGGYMKNNAGLVDVRYTFNCGSTLVANKSFFIVGTIGNDGYFYLDQTQPWSLDYPTTEDNKLYILIGPCYDTYRVNFELYNPIYIFKNGKLQLYSQYASETEWANITGKPSTFMPSAHTHPYTDLTGSTTTADLAIVSNGTANGWTLKTLGSRAFDSTAYLPLAGGTMNNNAIINKAGANTTYVKGRDSAIIRTNSYSGYGAIFSAKTSNGSWDFVAYSSDSIMLTYITDENYNNNTNSPTYILTFPKDSGTIALTKLLTDFVTMSTTQTITGVKTFSNGFKLSTATSWDNADRTIPFSFTNDSTKIAYVYNDNDKGLTYNPNTGALKAGSFVKRGGTSSQFLKADGSVDTNTYSTTSHTHAWDSLTRTSTTAGQVIVSTSTANGWELKTLGSNAFNSTGYLPLTGGTLSGDLAFSHGSNARDQFITWASGTHYQRLKVRDGLTDVFVFQYSTDSGSTWLDYFTIRNGSALIGTNAVLDAANYTTYTVKKDGTGATGTWGIGITGNAATATEFASTQSVTLTGDTTGTASSKAGWSIATTTKYLTGFQRATGTEATAALTTSPGNGKIIYNYNVLKDTTGLFANINNANGILTINKHPGNYDSQLGFSSNGNLYYRSFGGTALNTTQAWKQIAFTDSNITGQASYAANVGSAGTLGTNYVAASKVIAACNWYDTVTGSDTDSVINRWDEIVNFVSGFEETPDLATYLANNYLAKTGNSTASPMTGTIYVKDVNPLVLLSTNLDLDIWRVTGNNASGAWDNSYGFYLRYNGTGDGNNNSLSLWANNQTGNDIEVYRVKLDGILNFLTAPTINGTAISLSTHDHDDRYLKLIGGTLTGTLNLDSNTMGAVAHLTFNREYSYILNKASNGKFCFLANNAAAGASANADLIIADGAIYPGTSGHTSLGSSGNKFNQLYLSGLANIAGAATLSSTLSVAGVVTFTGLSNGTSNFTDNTEFVTSYADDAGFDTTSGYAGRLYRRKASLLYNYIKGKTDSLYLPLSGGTMTGPINWGTGATREILLFSTNSTWKSGLRYSWSNNTTVALWGKQLNTQFVWNAGTDAELNGTTTKTYDFQVGRDTSGTYNGKVVGRIAGNIIWHADNDGAGSGLDADLLDGQHGSYYLKEANLEWGGKNFSGAYGPIDAVMVDELGACRTMFAKAAGIVIEYSRDSGATWLDYGATDVLKIGLFSNGYNFYIGKSTTNGGSSASYMLRVTLRTSAAGIYTVLNKFIIYLSSSGSSGCYCTIRARTQQNYEDGVDTWQTLANLVTVSGWSGYNVINTTATTTYGNTKASQYGEWLFIFGCTGFSGNYPGLSINKIFGFGGFGWTTPSTMAKTGHLYSYDALQNATFPAQVTATAFKKSGGTSSLFLKADGSVDSNTYITSASIGNGTLSLQASGTTKTSFTANQSENATFNIATGTTNGALLVGGANVTVKGLGTDGVNKNLWFLVNGLYVNFDAENKTFRRGTAAANNDTTLGTATYPWKALYADTVYENGTSLANTYLKLSGGTMTGAITASINASNATDLTKGINFGENAHLGYSNGLGLYSKGEIWIRPAQSSLSTADSTKGLKITGTTFTYNNTNVSLEGHTHSEYVTSVAVTDDETNHANQLRYVKNGVSTYFTVPYATKAGKTGAYLTNSSYTIASGKGKEITLSSFASILISGSDSLSGGRFFMWFGGYGATSVRCTCRVIVPGKMKYEYTSNESIILYNNGGSEAKFTITCLMGSYTVGSEVDAPESFSALSVVLCSDTWSSYLSTTLNSTYVLKAGDTMTGDLIIDKESTYASPTGYISGLTVKANGHLLAFGFGTGGVNRGITDKTKAKWLIYTDNTDTLLQIGNVKTAADIIAAGKVCVGTGGTNSFIGSDSASNIYLHNSSGYVLVVDGLAVRCSSSTADATLGISTRPWNSLYVNTININSNKGGAEHINFNRAGYNYVNIPTNGTFAVSFDTSTIANSYFTVEQSATYPGLHNGTVNLGTSSYQWNNLYAKTIYEDGTSLASKYVTLATDLSITGEKTFTGDKRIKFKLSTSSNKLGFTLYDSSDVEVGFLEWQSSSLNSKPGLMLGQWIDQYKPSTPGYLGFKVVNVTTAARYALVTPLLADAKTPLSLNDTIKTFYFPLLFKNGSTTTLTASSGVVDLSTLIPSYSTQNMSVNGTNYALYTSASSLPTIIAPTAYAGTGGYILATNTNKNGLEWVAKPTSNVSTSAVLATANNGTTHITATLSDPYYNLIEGSSVARSIQFKAGTGMTVSTTTAGVITFTNSLTTKNITVNGTTYALYTSESSLPTIYAPTALAGTGGYILATNSGKTGVEWVAKPTSNVSTSAVVSSSASGTTQISAAQSDPYYNLIEGSSVARSIRFVAGTGISISAATDGQITITNTAGGGGSTTVSSILSSTSTGTSAISGDTLDPYYNLLVNSAVSSSVLFKAGNNISVTAGTDNSITFSNTLTNMSLLTNNLFVNGTQTATTNSWKGKLPAEITSLYDGLTIFYRLPYAGNSSNASLQLYALDGTTTIGANCPVYGGNTRLTTHYPQYSIIRMTYYNGEWRANPYYNTNTQVTQTNSAITDYRPLLLGSLSNATYTAIPTTLVTNSVCKSSHLVYSSNYGRMYMTGTTADTNRGYYVKYSTTAFLGLCIGSDGVQMGLRDAKNGTWLCYCDDGVGESLKVPGTLIPLVINLAEHCLIAYDSTNQCINFTFT